MEGKKEYIRAVYEVVQELMRQLLINNGNGFDYVPQSSRGVAQYADINEQLKILSALEKHGVIELRSPRDWAQWSGEADYTTYEVVATRKKLEKYASKLRKLLQPINESSESSNGRIPCVLRLHDIELLLKVNGYDEQVIARLHDGRDPHILFTAMSNVSPGTTLQHLEIFPSGKHIDLWQVLARSNLGHLRPFFKWSKGKITNNWQTELSKAQVIEIISKINEKNRKNFVEIEKSL